MNKDEILKLRKNNELHEIIENRLQEIFKKISPDFFTLPESYGITSGRTDTTVFSTKGKIIHIEIIASENMVFRDITNLHQSSADLCIAILMDENYDPKVAKAFYRANAKNVFPTIWMSDILNELREQYVIGRLEESIQVINRQLENLDEIINEKLDGFIKTIEMSQGDLITQHLGIFPRRFLSAFNKSSLEKELYSNFEPMGIREASGPFPGTIGFSWKFRQHGKFFIVRTPSFESICFTEIAVGDGGEVIFSFVDGREINQEIWASGVPKIFSPTFNFIGELYKNKNYDGMLDIIVLIKGIKDLRWIQKGQENNHLSKLLYGRKFYEDTILIPRQSILTVDISKQETRDNFYNNLNTILQRNTERIDWK